MASTSTRAGSWPSTCPAQVKSASPEVRWTYRKSVPYIASPLVLDGVFYVAQGGGIVTTIDPETGEVFHRGRLSQGAKQFYASPVAADGKLFLVDTEGRLTVLKAGQRVGRTLDDESRRALFCDAGDLWRADLRADVEGAVLLRQQEVNNSCGTAKSVGNARGTGEPITVNK